MKELDPNGKITELVNCIVYKLYRKKFYNGFKKVQVGNYYDVTFTLCDKQGNPMRHILKKLKIGFFRDKISVMMIDISNDVIGQFILSTPEEEEALILYIVSFIIEHTKACIKVDNVKAELFGLK